MPPKDKLGDELGRAQVIDMFDDVDLFVQAFERFLVPIVVELTLAPPERFLAAAKLVLPDTATAALHEEPRQRVLYVSVVEFAAVDDRALNDLVRFLTVGDRRLVLVTLRRHRINTTNQRLREAKVLVVRDTHGKSRPDHGCKTTNKTENEVK